MINRVKILVGGKYIYRVCKYTCALVDETSDHDVDDKATRRRREGSDTGRNPSTD